jgi:ribosomal protein S18 acetylase RimI-like enzyme
MPMIVTGDTADLERLRGLWLELHHHHLRIATYPTPTDDEQSWQVRHDDYHTALDNDTGFLLLAVNATDVLGYAMVLLHSGGPNDTFVLGPTYAELYTLVVAAAHRGTGIGTALFNTVERELELRSITELEIAVMANNLDAQIFYQRHGARRVETMLWKFGHAHTSSTNRTCRPQTT